MGRRDGQVSSASNVRPNMVDTTFTLNEMLQLFSSKGRSLDDPVTLSGAHTIGSAHCSTFRERFREDPNGTLTPVDASLDASYAAELAERCATDAAAAVTVSNDPATPSVFDGLYYRNVLAGRGLFELDSALAADPRTRGRVEAFSHIQESFLQSWAESFVRLTSVGVKTGSVGAMRGSCQAVSR